MLKFFRRTALQTAYRFSKRRYLQLLLLIEDRRFPNLRNPRTFNEKLNAHKLATVGNPLMVQLADKIEVKAFVAERIGEQHLIPTLWHGENLPPRNERNWPRPYVIKSSHGSNHTIFVRNDEPDWDQIEATTAKWLKQEFGRWAYEWVYLEMTPRLLIEPFIGDGSQVPTDYKFFCFDGQPRIIQVDVGRYDGHRRSFHDLDWGHANIQSRKQQATELPPKPEKLDEMIRIAKDLSRDFPFVRVDLYEVDGQVLFGEMTFFPQGGMHKFSTPAAQKMFSDFWDYRPAAASRRASLPLATTREAVR